MMDAESIEDPTSSKPKRSPGKPGKRCFPNMPQTLHERKIKMPKELFRRPGILLPTCSCSYLLEEKCDHPRMNYDELKSISKILVGDQIDIQTLIDMQQSDPMIQTLMSKAKMPNHFTFQQSILMFGINRNTSQCLACITLLLE
jgi:hypothetical protein